MKKFISVVLCFVFAATFAGAAFAAGTSIQPRWTHIYSIRCGVTANTVRADVISEDSSNTVSIIVTLQSRDPSWSDTLYVWYASGVGSASVNQHIALGHGEYRAKIQVTIKSPSGAVLETTTVYSDPCRV